jgi:prepilin-type N-terminal cleavage/methylation domain-containing protein
MRRGFTILELLVAALLLGMLVTVLTMVFNQSSIAWRTGVTGLMDMDEVRDNIAAVRDEADSIYIWNNELHRTLSIWKEDGSGTPQLRKRAVDSADNTGVEERSKVQYLKGQSGLTQGDLKAKDTFGPVDVKQTESQSGKNWIVNVKSRGPNGVLNDYDDIWSMPDDFE